MYNGLGYYPSLKHSHVTRENRTNQDCDPSGSSLRNCPPGCMYIINPTKNIWRLKTPEPLYGNTRPSYITLPKTNISHGQIHQFDGIHPGFRWRNHTGVRRSNTRGLLRVLVFGVMQGDPFLWLYRTNTCDGCIIWFRYFDVAIRLNYVYTCIWHDMMWYDVIWCDMIRYDMIWYNRMHMIWYDMIWYDMIW